MSVHSGTVVHKMIVTERSFPIRPAYDDDDGRAVCTLVVFGGYRVYYGLEDWASASYWLVPSFGKDETWRNYIATGK